MLLTGGRSPPCSDLETQAPSLLDYPTPGASWPQYPASGVQRRAAPSPDSGLHSPIGQNKPRGHPDPRAAGKCARAEKWFSTATLCNGGKMWGERLFLGERAPAT